MEILSAFMICMGGFGFLIMLSNALYGLMSFILRKLEEREKRNSND